jgi:predicted ATPase
LRREPGPAFVHAQRELALSQQHEFGMWLVYSKADSGAALIEGKNTEDGLNWMREYFASTNVTGHSFNRPLHLAVMASGAAQLQRWDQVTEYLAAALRQVESSGERWFEAELHRLRGEFMLAEHATLAAERAAACFDQSLAIARMQGARLWELRTSLSLAKLRVKQGRGSVAGDLLAPVYASFVEGFGTQDLQEAKALLDNL